MNTNAPLGQTSDGCGVERRSSGGLAGQVRLTVQKGDVTRSTRWLPAYQRQSAEQLLRERGYVVVAEDYR